MKTKEMNVNNKISGTRKRETRKLKKNMKSERSDEMKTEK